MFGKKSDESNDAGAPPPQRKFGVSDERRVTAWIGSSVVIQGDLRSSEDLSIAGRVQGDVTAREHTVLVAPKARIHGNVVARSVVVHGHVEGTITAEQRIEVGEAGVVEGDIVAPRMAVAEGATLNGTLRVRTQSRATTASGQQG